MAPPPAHLYVIPFIVVDVCFVPCDLSSTKAPPPIATELSNVASAPVPIAIVLTALALALVPRATEISLASALTPIATAASPDLVSEY